MRQALHSLRTYTISLAGSLEGAAKERKTASIRRWRILAGVSGMIAVVETEEFMADVKGVLSEDERDDLTCMWPSIPKRVI